MAKALTTFSTPATMATSFLSTTQNYCYTPRHFPQIQNPTSPIPLPILIKSAFKLHPITNVRRKLRVGTSAGETSDEFLTGKYSGSFEVSNQKLSAFTNLRRKFIVGVSAGDFFARKDSASFGLSNQQLSSITNLRRKFIVGTSVGDSGKTSDDILVGEDSASFEISNQKLSSWIKFTLVLGVVLFGLNYIWIDNSTGFGHYYVDSVEEFARSPELSMLSLTIIFAAVHSGLASFRNVGEKLMGERAFRVLFAGVSLPLAVSTVVYFINHRYDGMQLWQLQSVPGVHQLVWISSLISFLFLYPSTFNLLEVAAVDKPKLHMWETGIMRITRHPQMVGQVIWCLAHTLWIGNSVAIAASIGLIGHHLFGVWNGDRRLALKYGDSFEVVRNRTSIIPFAAIITGRQKLPENYYREFFRLPYLAVTAVTLGAYFAHPLMQSASFRLHW